MKKEKVVEKKTEHPDEPEETPMNDGETTRDKRKSRWWVESSSLREDLTVI